MAPLWWIVLVAISVAALLQRRVMFDIRLMPILVLAAFVFVMAGLGENQGRYSYFFIYLCSLYVGSDWLRDPLGVGCERS